jgi:PhoH-like ATPase
MAKKTDSSNKTPKTKANVKIFVLDTNILLHDFRAIYNFAENDIVIPIIVLEELDKFKKGSDQINFNAREFVRELDKLTDDDLFVTGVKLGPGRGTLLIDTNSAIDGKVRDSFSERIPDNIILNTTERYTDKFPYRRVVLVSKDVNLRMKAKSLGIFAEDYENDKVENIDIFEEGIKVFSGINDALIVKLYEDKKNEGLPISDFKIKQPESHDYFIMKSDKGSVVCYYNPAKHTITRISKKKIYGIEPRNSEQMIALHALMNPDIELIALTGKAGTGKTLLALAAAIHQNELYDQILLARPMVSLADKDMGFLPGGEKDKIKPFMQPLFDNLTVIKQAFKNSGIEVHNIDQMLANQHLLITPLAYIRGRSLSKVFFIIDESQNLTPHEVKTIITRAGEGTKIVFTGDIQQIDSPYLDSMSNGLSHLSDRMKGQDMFAHVNLIKGERSRLADIASNLL